MVPRLVRRFTLLLEIPLTSFSALDLRCTLGYGGLGAAKDNANMGRMRTIKEKLLRSAKRVSGNGVRESIRNKATVDGIAQERSYRNRTYMPKRADLTSTRRSRLGYSSFILP